MHQTRFGGATAPDHEKGNCYEACLASLFGFPLDSIPSYKDASWFVSYQRWLRKRGLMSMSFTSDPFDYPEYREFGISIAAGPGPRGHVHAVLWQDGKLLHDPHPSGAGLLSVDTYDVFAITDPDLYFRSRLRDDRFA